MQCKVLDFSPLNLFAHLPGLRIDFYFVGHINITITLQVALHAFCLLGNIFKIETTIYKALN